jgi:spermidine synthase
MGGLRYEIVDSAPTDAIVALYEAAGWWSDAPGEREGIPGLIRGSFRFMVARAEHDHIVGMARALSDGVSDAYIQDVVVLPKFRGQGVGAEMIRRLVAECRGEGISWIGLIAEPGTEDFYRRLGFSVLSGYRPMRHGLAATP